MFTIGRYTLGDRIHEGGSTVLHRGFREPDRAPVTLKLPRAFPPRPRDLARLQHEYTLLGELRVPGLVEAYALERDKNGVALVLEALDGEPLDTILARGSLSIQEALRIAIELARMLGAMHRLGVVHKDVQPGHVLIERGTGKVRLVDVGMATRLSPEAQIAASPEVLEGALTYLSPEQTGRMNRPLDRRADLYSFGATLYHLLTGHPPFDEADPIELVYSHIARTPAPPRARREAIPEVLSEIVMKLLSKAPEDRYQTADGVRNDLRACLAELGETGDIRPFPVGRDDRAPSPFIPQRLYGRAAEERELLAAFERVAAGAAELLLVSGYSGIGKSALVHEVHEPIARRGGSFVAGKFDQFNRNVPYAPITRAFRDLVRQLLSSSPERLARDRAEIARAAGVNGQVLVDLIPELSLVLGPQPAVPALGSTEAQNRFNLVFSGFVRALATAERPLVLFLDDLQWADPASLKLLQVLLSDPERHHLLVLGAYRDNEVGPAHPLVLALEALRRGGTSIGELRLGPLGVADLTELLSAALGADQARAQPLARTVAVKTQGNPFFVSQFLRSLHAEGLLASDPETGAWTWRLADIDGREVTENVVEFVASKLRLLSPETRRALELAACIGHGFDLRTLSTIQQKPPHEVASALREALTDGLVLPLHLDDRFVHGTRAGGAAVDGELLDIPYRFLHDRVQQAAYSLIEESLRPDVHLSIGRLLLESRRGDEEALFGIVNHLNLGAPRMSDDGEKVALAELNLAAGRKARGSTAYDASAHHFQTGAALLGERGWAEHYPLCFALHVEQAECEVLCGRFERAEALFQRALAEARTPLDRVRVQTAHMDLDQSAGRFPEGVARGLRILRSFGIDVPEAEEAIAAATEAAREELARALSVRPLAAQLDAPALAAPEHRALVRVLSTMLPLTYLSRPSLLPLMTLKLVNFCVEHGNAEETSFGYAVYALVLAGVSRDYARALEVSELAIKLSEKLADPRWRGPVLHGHANHILFWRKHFRHGVPVLEQAFQACLAAGDLNQASYLAFEAVWQAVERGDVLDEVLRVSEGYAAFARQARNEAVHQTIRVQQQFVRSLKGLTRRGTLLDDEQFDEGELLAKLDGAKFVSGIAFHRVIRLVLLYTYERYEEARAAAVAAREVLGAVVALPIDATFHFYEALTLLACHEGPAATAAEVEARIGEPLAKLAHWAESCPENFAYRALLVRAEAARVAGAHADAEELYDRAIAAAEENGFVHGEALANELAAKYYTARGRHRIARVYMSAAYHRYLQWGAAVKAERVMGRDAELVGRGATLAPSAAPPPASSFPPPANGPGGGFAALDVDTVIRLGQALAGEVEISRVLDQLMRIVLKSAGGRRGLLVMEREGALDVVARISAEPDRVEVGLHAPFDERHEVPLSVVRYVARTQETVVLGDATRDACFGGDPCVVAGKLRSILCLPLAHQRRLIGVLYLDHDLSPDAFSPERTGLLEIVCSQAATALENARLYEHVREVSAELARANARLEDDIRERTEELREANERLVEELSERARAEEARARLQDEIIQMKDALVLELSTPLIPITDSLMVMPLIGRMDERRARQVIETVLRGAADRRAKAVILDITGMKDVDTSMADVLVRTATALRILGTKAVLTGMSPEAAQTLIGLGIDLGGIVTCGTLQSGIAYAMTRGRKRRRAAG